MSASTRRAISSRVARTPRLPPKAETLYQWQTTLRWRDKSAAWYRSMGQVDAATAALIGAAVGAAVSLSSQFLGHGLALQQDRRNQRRERLTDAVIDAGAALHGATRDERMSDEEFDQWKASLNPDSVAAQNPELHHDLLPFNEGVYRAMVTLELHAGQDHWLNEEYLNAIVKCAEAEEAKSKHFRSKDEKWRISDIPHLAEVAKEARQAQDHWMKLAREEIERI